MSRNENRYPCVLFKMVFESDKRKMDIGDAKVDIENVNADWKVSSSRRLFLRMYDNSYV